MWRLRALSAVGICYYEFRFIWCYQLVVKKIKTWTGRFVAKENHEIKR